MIGVILIGKPNSGKSTIGREVANKLGIRYISSGDIARSMDDIQDDLNSGKMAPENRIRYAILDKIMSCDVSYILDGFPRFYDQYEWLKDTFTHKLIYVYINTPDYDAVFRAIQRSRADDSSIRKRLKYFWRYTKPMLTRIQYEEDVYRIDNSDDDNIQNNIDYLAEIVERHRNAHRLKVYRREI